MPPRKPPTILALPPAQALADRLRAALDGDADYNADDLPTETDGAIEPGAMFHVSDQAGQVWRVRVIRHR